MSEKDFNAKNTDQQERVISIDRVTKVVKGGKNMRFRASVVVGDLKGSVGFGVSKSIEVPKAIRKAIEAAKKSKIQVQFLGTTIPHDIEGKYEASRVILKPARKGTGVIAGGAVRAVLELAGIKDVVAKSKGSSSPVNAARATIFALSKLMNQKNIEDLRGVKISTYNTSERSIAYGDKIYPNSAAEQAVEQKEEK
ncbi:30S ribosomal protein S5 [Candidatus Termititenax spirochaetophilus]|uniref:Small ribosomal subunit protein uS5 n=1 Tax=Candidatus Termititenax spirochaetophilus TaxID=2218522 RepID=A0A388T751_9BACT|nr:30S ribosomal protein S5 [Candidatus Termititenax spirochaetophilus]